MKRLLILLLVSVFAQLNADAQTSFEKKVVLQGFWWDYWNNNYPNGWANYVADLAPRLKTMGVDAVWIPPSIKNNAQVVGYSPFDNYDLGDKRQKGSTSTRVGDKNELLRMVAVLHANGIEVIQDLVPNHLSGAGSDNGGGGQDPAAPVTACTDQWKNFRYACYETPATDQSSGDYLGRKGRFPKNHHNFHPNGAHTCSSGLCDPNIDAWCWQAFGPDACYYDGALGYSSNATYNPDQSTYSPNNNGGTGTNNGYIRKNTREWLIWYKKQMGFDGIRLDAVKHYPEAASEDFLYSLQHNSGFASGGDEMFAVGEWVGSTGVLDAWVAAVQNRSGTFDYNLRAFDASGGLFNLIYNYGTYDMGALPGAQQNLRYVDIAGVRIHRTVPFINNHDTYHPYLDANGNITGWESTFSPRIDMREPRLAAAYASMVAMDGNPQIFFEDLLNVANTSKRWTHLPTNTTDLPFNQDIANIMKCHGALDFKGGSYLVPSNSGTFYNNVTGSNNNDDILVIERSGKAIIGATDSWDVDQDVWMDTNFPVGTVLADYSGGYNTTVTVQCPSGGCGLGGANRVNIKTRGAGYPTYAFSENYADQGAHYHGYSIWAPEGININNYSNAPIPTTQEWDMDNDLGDSHCLSLGQGGRTPDNSPNDRVVGKIFPAGSTTVTYSVTLASPGTSLTLDFYDLNGNVLHSAGGSTNPLTGSFANATTRWITIKIRNTAANTPGQRCWVKATYSAPAVASTNSYAANTLVSIWTSNGGSSDWNNCRNWEEGSIPPCSGTVIIPHPVAFLPVADPCFTGTITVGYCIAPNVSAPAVTQPVSCLLPEGSIVVNATGTFSNLEYSVNNGVNWQSSNSFSNLPPGNYFLKARNTGSLDCSTAYSGNPVVLAAPVAPSVSAPTVTQPVSCLLPAGSIVVNASTTSGTLEYSVNNGTSWQSSNSFPSLPPGEYFLKVRNASSPDCSTNYSGNPVVLDIPGACCPTFTNGCASGDFIQDFTLSNFTNAASGCGNSGFTNYSNYSGTGPNVQAGETYSATLKAGPNTQYFAVYIDFDGNGNFTDPGEFFPIGQATGSSTVSANISIPVSLATGTRSLRVRSSAGPALTAADGCDTNLGAGETEDYDIHFFCPNNLAVDGLPIPGGAYNADVEITSLGRVETGTNVAFNAGASAFLMPNFEVQLGGVFEVILVGCF